MSFSYPDNQLMRSYVRKIKQRLKQFKGKMPVKRTGKLLTKLISQWKFQTLINRKKRTIALTAASENIDALSMLQITQPPFF